MPDGDSVGSTPFQATITFTNIFQYFTTTSTFILVFFVVMISVFNSSIKGIIYLGGLLITTFFNYIFMHVIKNEYEPGTSGYCSIFQFPGRKYNAPSLGSVVYGFTMAYLFAPMTKGPERVNIPIIITLTTLFLINTYTKIKNNCNPSWGIVLGFAFGVICGITQFTLLDVTGYSSLLYFDEITSNNVVCSRPKDQNFVCSVWKNGQIIKNL
jgi:hypothetical protein